MWTINEAMDTLMQTFPNRSVAIADGDFGYLVGTVEDADEIIIASFQFILDSSEKMVIEIRIAQGQTYCGYSEVAFPSESLSNVVPIQITRRGDDGNVWGLIGDYEVCISNHLLVQR